MFSVASILVLAKFIEPVWGSKEFVTFLAATNAATGACTLVLLYVIFAFTQYSEKSGDLLFLEIAGFEGVVAACLVAVKQIIPDNEITVFSFIRFRAKVCPACTCLQPPAWLSQHAAAHADDWCALQHLPSIFLVLAVGGSFPLGTSISTIPFVCFGAYSAWVYLRFFQMNSELSVR